MICVGSTRTYSNATSFGIGCSKASCVRCGGYVKTSNHNDLLEATFVHHLLHDKGTECWLSPEPLPSYGNAIDHLLDDIGAEMEKTSAQVKGWL